MKSTSALLIGLFLCGATISPALSAIVTVPKGLKQGDKYRLVFITSDVRDATSSDIAVYNQFVASTAASIDELNGLATEWNAIASTVSIDARDNTETNPNSDGQGVPIYLLNGNFVALNNSDLWDGNIQNFLNVLPSGLSLIEDPGGNAFLAHTGTLMDGTAPFGSTLPGSLGSPNQFGRVWGGNPFITNHNWIEGAGNSQSDLRPLYGISGVLTVIPETSSAVLAIFWLGVMVTRRRRLLAS